MNPSRAWLCALAILPAACASLDPSPHGKVRVGAEDTLLDLARTHELGYGEIVAANPDTDPWLPGVGTEVVLPTVHLPPSAGDESIVVNLATQRLWFFDPGDEAVHSYPIGIGRPGWRTPLGTTRVKAKREAPTWHPPESARREDPSLPAAVGPGPDNPLGTHALYLGWPRYLIHGTNQPLGVGRRISRGCIRLYPEHIVDLYARAGVGMQVRVVNEPVQLGWIGEELFMEVHPPVSQQAEGRGPEPTLALGPALEARIRKLAGDETPRLDWEVVKHALAAQRGVPVAITRPKPGPFESLFRS